MPPEDACRPFYHRFAWAYDLLVADAVGPHVDFIQETLGRRAVAPGSAILDAGCGTGRYARELARRGFQVLGVDRSPELIAQARAGGGEPRGLRFAVADLATWSPPRLFDGILCRGVLNDVLDDAARDAILGGFARALCPGGVLVLDARDWEPSAARYAVSPVSERSLPLPDGTLHFRSEIALDRAGQRLLAHECFTVARGGVEQRHLFDFVMRCWTWDELHARLTAAGFHHLERRLTYGPAGRPFTDRLIAIATT